MRSLNHEGNVFVQTYTWYDGVVWWCGVVVGGGVFGCCGVVVWWCGVVVWCGSVCGGMV